MEMVRLERNSLLLVFMAIIFAGAISNGSHADPVEDKQALLDFLNNMHYSKSHQLNWDHSSSVCSSWTGVTCKTDHSRVIALRLPGMGIQGSIPTNTLSRLSELQILSLRSNGISGSFPSDFAKLQNLTALYLQFNNFTGPLPLDFSVWNNLAILDLSNNGFNGSIPPSVSNLTHLSALNLANNSLSGPVPDINVPSLQLLNLANNNLSGNVPPSLLRFPSSVFSGNHLAAESAIPPAMPLKPPTPQPAKKKSKISEPAILGIVLGGSVLGFVSIALLMVCCNSMRKKKGGLPTKSQKKERSSKAKALESQEKDNRLVFFEGCSFAFDLEDLLRASAEVLGKGTYGTTYKAALEDLTTVVVKRLKEVSVPKKEFEQRMEVVGSIRHQNVSALRAYYYSKDEKLMVYDYYAPGSVSALLHGKGNEGRNPLNWETRLRIAVGAARGIAHVHTQSAGKLVHGNIKASNIFLNHEGYGCLSDIGLATLMNPTSAPAARLPGYRAPEITDTRKATPASDVYSFGVLLLELLTGKSPVQATGGEEVVHLVRWVNSVVREEWTAEVFDVELLKYPNIEEEMVEMLQVGMNCVVRMPEQRPKMPDVVKMVEDIRRASSPVAQSQAQSETNLQIAASASTQTPAPVPTQSETNMQIAASTSASTPIPAPALAPAAAPPTQPTTQAARAGTSAPSTTSH